MKIFVFTLILINEGNVNNNSNWKLKLGMMGNYFSCPLWIYFKSSCNQLLVMAGALNDAKKTVR